MKKTISKTGGAMFLLIALLLPWSRCYAGYPASTIADSLKKNANAVVREYLIDYTYQTPTSNRLKHREVLTVLNKNGDEEAVFSEYYDKFRKFNSLVINLYDGDGNLIRKVKPSEILDLPGSKEYDLYSDIRYKYFEPLVSVYPYTIEVDYEMDIAGSYYFPEWQAFYDFNVSIEQTELILHYPKDYVVNYRLLNNMEEPRFLYGEKLRTCSWKMTGVTALDREPYRDDPSGYLKGVLTAPSDFILDGYPGNLNTWQDLAAWIYSLGISRDVLAPARVAELNTLVKDAGSELEKVKILYALLQKQTRYFNIRLGIGGLQPMEASKVDAVGYGDCKGLSNYMKAMLKAVGIRSNLALVNSGGDFPRMVRDFPSHQFDHVILCVPLSTDTIWLECTDQTIPFGFLGDYTSDRDVLLIGEGGGKLVHTPVYGMDQNVQTTTARVTLSAEGNASAEVIRRFACLQYDDYARELQYGIKDQNEWLHSYLKVPNLHLDKFSFTKKVKDTPEAVLQVTLRSDAYATASGKRLFLTLNLLNRTSGQPAKLEKRWGNVRRLVPYTDTDSVQFILPEGTAIEFLPESKQITSRFGTYRIEISRIPGGIAYVRKVEMYNGLFPAASYDELIRFYKDMSTADKLQAILVKNIP